MKSKHAVLMLVCCLIPVIAFGAIFALNIPASSILMFGLVLLCPLSHLLMMKYMGHDEQKINQATHQHREQL